MSTAGSQTVTATYTEEGVTVTATYTLTIVAASWHTVWSGSKQFGVTWKTSSSGSNTITGNGTLVSTSSLQPNVLTRLTFTKTNVSNSSEVVHYSNNSDNLHESFSSPLEFTNGTLGQDLVYALVKNSSSTSLSFNFSIWTHSGSSIGIWIGNISGYNVNPITSYVTLTKIEQYY